MQQPGLDLHCARAPGTFSIFAAFSCQIWVKTEKGLAIQARGRWHCVVW